jgi:hypothetical protein
MYSTMRMTFRHFGAKLMFPCRLYLVIATISKVAGGKHTTQTRQASLKVQGRTPWSCSLERQRGLEMKTERQRTEARRATIAGEIKMGVLLDDVLYYLSRER